MFHHHSTQTQSEIDPSMEEFQKQSRFAELQGKRIHDPLDRMKSEQQRSGSGSRRCVWVPGPVIVGAGPAGLAAAACLKTRGIPSLILERSDCVGSLWRRKTYDRLRLHLPRSFCELPHMQFPANFPTYPTRDQFLAYLDAYAAAFGISPEFGSAVESAEYDPRRGLWRVIAGEVEYACQWLVVATGENAEEVVPEIEGMAWFAGRVLHSSAYRSGEDFRDQRVLVVGCGNSGMELSLDLCNFNARPSLVIRDSVHVLPQQVLGRSTFALSMWLLKWFPLRLVDQFLLLASYLTLGDTSRLGLRRPKTGPLQLKNTSGKTPVLDVGTLAMIRAGNIKIFGGIKRITRHGAEFVDGRAENFDAIVLATGFKSNVPSWLKESDMFNGKDGMPRKPFPNGWKGRNGLYAAGFTKRGLLGASIDARKIAEDIEDCWKSDENHFIPFAPAPTADSPLHNPF